MRNLPWIGWMAAALLIGCGDDKPAESTHETPPSSDGPFALAVACKDEIASVYASVDTASAGSGAILRCARDGAITKDALQAKLDADGFTAAPITSGIHVYRVLYRTERGNAAHSPGTSSALILLPDTLRAKKLPVVVASHGSHGQCEACAPSKADPVTQSVRGDFERQVYSLAGYGYAVIAPDLAGYADYGATGNPPPAYGASADVGKSTLDGARALRRLIPTALTDQVVLVGHSQGGHTALSALALSDSYGAGGSIVGVALYAPLWLTQRSWGAVTAFASLFPFEGSEGTNAVALWYHYTRAELIDGPGHGVDVFQDDKRAAIVDFVKTAPWGGSGWDALHALGQNATDIFAPAFVAAVGNAAAGTSPSCATSGDAGALCERWMSRYAEDRPHITGSAATVPILIAWGAKDTTIASDRITCAIDRLKSDAVPLTVCVDPSADHGGIVGAKASYVADWIGARALGEADVTPCADDESAIVDPKGMPAVCNSLPPND